MNWEQHFFTLKYGFECLWQLILLEVNWICSLLDHTTSTQRFLDQSLDTPNETWPYPCQIWLALAKTNNEHRWQVLTLSRPNPNDPYQHWIFLRQNKSLLFSRPTLAILRPNPTTTDRPRPIWTFPRTNPTTFYQPRRFSDWMQQL